MQENGTIADHHIRSTGWSCDLGQEDCQKRDRRKVIWNAHTVFIKLSSLQGKKKKKKKREKRMGQSIFTQATHSLHPPMWNCRKKNRPKVHYIHELFFPFVFSFLLTRPRTKRRNTVNGIGQLFFFLFTSTFQNLICRNVTLPHNNYI